MNKNDLIGLRVMNKYSRRTGTIKDIKDNEIVVEIRGEDCAFPYPDCFTGVLELEDEALNSEFETIGAYASFENFKREYRFAVNKEIEYLKSTGGKKYHAIDGEKLQTVNGEYMYAFDTDTEMHFPDGTVIKIRMPDRIIGAYIVSCENFSIIIRTSEFMGNFVEAIEFTAEQWLLLEALTERLSEIEADTDSIAFELACKGNAKIERYSSIRCGQNYALNRAVSEAITFIWGPPGTGKTETLSNIALEYMSQGKRVLMLSYSNVSVDGALLRVAKKAESLKLQVVRYGYPRVKELAESRTLTSYGIVLSRNPALESEYYSLLIKKRKLKGKNSEIIEVNKRLNKIREILLDEEKQLIQSADFVATTVSKAVIDKSIYSQGFDAVIFDEASMAYVPQIIFSSSLAKSNFVCLGDFCQLPAIVQNPECTKLMRDIFEYTKITQAVHNGFGHEWLVMLDTQYRMHYEIAGFVNLNMYSNRLKTSDKIYESRKEIASNAPKENEAIVLMDLSDMYSVCIKTMDGSRINLMSAMVSVRIAEKYIGKYETGIITPYNAQSRLVLAMIRDLQEKDERYMSISCATVHQFQGSEKPVIIYDAVDCFRMPYPGTLITSMKNDNANRLFNVAITRAQGKFILVANTDYFIRKNLSDKLLFRKAIDYISKNDSYLHGDKMLEQLNSKDEKYSQVYVNGREESFGCFLADLASAESSINIDMPGEINDDEGLLEKLINCLEQKNKENVEITIRCDNDLVLPPSLQKYVKVFSYVTNPVTIIDKRIIWFGQPLSAADFISNGSSIDTRYFPCFRFDGKHTARLLKAFLEM